MLPTENYLKDKHYYYHIQYLKQRWKDMKNITFKNIPDELYFKAVELKGKIHAKNWQEFLEKVIEELGG